MLEVKCSECITQPRALLPCYKGFIAELKTWNVIGCRSHDQQKAKTPPC